MFLPQQDVNAVIPHDPPHIGIWLLEGMSPTSVVYDGKLYVFYNGSDNNGIWFTQFNGHSWSLIDNVKRHRP
ncbi:hypothetical protein M408DRAFT_31281, partial [Serendipita vermifera MAFF 305830]